MVDAARHPNVEIMAYHDLVQVDGFIGNFRVELLKKPRYVKADLCTGCGECAQVCPIEIPNAFEMDLAPRKAIDVPHGQAVPLIYAIDMDNCIQCYQCVDTCGFREAIDFSQEPEIVEREVGSIIVMVKLFPRCSGRSSGHGRHDPEPCGQHAGGWAMPLRLSASGPCRNLTR